MHSVILCQGFFAKTEHFLVRIFRLIRHQSSVSTPMFFLFFFRAVAPFYLHVTVFTKEHAKHANKGELVDEIEPLHEKKLWCAQQRLITQISLNIPNIFVFYLDKEMLIP